MSVSDYMWTGPGWECHCKQCNKQGMSQVVNGINWPPDGWVLGRYSEGIPWFCSAKCRYAWDSTHPSGYKRS